jgi:hypothetical protein
VEEKRERKRLSLEEKRERKRLSLEEKRERKRLSLEEKREKRRARKGFVPSNEKKFHLDGKKKRELFVFFFINLQK